MSENLWELHVRHAGDGRYQFTLANPFVGGLIFNEAIDVPAGIRRDIVERAQPPDDAGAVEAWVGDIGEQIAEAILPKTIRAELSALAGGHLEISTEDPQVPWEFAVGADGPLLRRVGVARRMYVASPITGWTAPPDRRWLEMLLVTNPTGDLGAADDEGEGIRLILASEPLIHLTVLSGADATATKLFKLLGDRRFDIFHYAGHVSPDQGDDNSALELHDTKVTAGYLMNRFSGAPEIVFVNGCRSGLAAGEPPTRVVATGRPAVEGMAYTFLAAGVRSYVGTLWDVQDSAASAVATSFYREVVSGATMGGALLQARGGVADRGAVAYASHLLYGRATDAVIGIQPAIERQRRLRTLRTMMTGDNEGRRRRAAILLGELADADATEALAAALDDASPAVQWRAVVGLAKIGTAKAMQILLGRLPTAGNDLALHIVVMLRDRLSPALSAGLRDVVTTTDDAILRANALITLGGTGDPANVPLLTTLLDHDDDLVQLLALEALGRAGPAALRALYPYQPATATLEAVKQRVVEFLEQAS
jgi:hypothetical protein